MRSVAYTSFFRDHEILEVAVAEVARREGHRREILAWDAGCASGEEPYTLAILMAEALGPFPFRGVRILATDREESAFPQFERKISEGRYAPAEVQWVPEALRMQYFQPTADTDELEVIDDLKASVRYVQHDLMTLVEPIQDCALVICKNVMLHLPEHQLTDVVAMFRRALKPGGILAFDRHQPMPPGGEAWFRPIHSSLPVFEAT